MRGSLSLLLLAMVTGAALGTSLPGTVQAQGACNSSSGVPAYSYTEIFDATDGPAFLQARMNDLGEVAMLLYLSDELGLNAPRCLVRHTGLTNRTVLCTQSVDPGSDVNRLETFDINNRGAIAIAGGRFPFTFYRFLVIPRSGPHTFVEAEGTRPELADDGNLAFEDLSTGALRGYRPASGDFVEIAAPGVYQQHLTSAPGGVLHLSSFSGGQIVRIRDAFTGSPTLESEPSPGNAGPIDRAGGFAYRSSAFSGIARRLAPFGNDVTVIDYADPAAPLWDAFTAFAKLDCSVALEGPARGICSGGPRDREFCDPFAAVDACVRPDGFCRYRLPGLFRWQGGPIVPLLLEGDPLFGSTITQLTIYEGNLAGQILFSVILADGRNLLVRGDPAGASASAPAGPSSCAGPACTFAAQPSGFTGLGPAGVPIYVSFGGLPSPGGGSADEALAGFDYAVAPGDPRFASVQIPFPLPNDQEAFLLEVGAASFPLVAGEQFDLAAIDHDGVATFSLRGIDTSQPVDPEDVVSGVTFVAEAPVEFTVMAVVPEPRAWAAGAAALLALLALATRPSTPLRR